jgi:hypothetical protein
MHTKSPKPNAHRNEHEHSKNKRSVRTAFKMHTHDHTLTQGKNQNCVHFDELYLSLSYIYISFADVMNTEHIRFYRKQVREKRGREGVKL